jgi:hypothetical protein
MAWWWICCSRPANGVLQPVEMKSGQKITRELVQAATAFSRRIGEPGLKP